ncbi:hypothetical protein Droror1_Dr00024534 [Drosera rotundifolia]
MFSSIFFLFRLKSKAQEIPKRFELKSSPQRISLSDICNLGSEFSLSDLSSSLMGSNAHAFSHEELRTVTNNFSSLNFLGEGGFEVIYKGFIYEGLRAGLDAQVVAVKVLNLEGSQG